MRLCITLFVPWTLLILVYVKLENIAELLVKYWLISWIFKFLSYLTLGVTHTFVWNFSFCSYSGCCTHVGDCIECSSQKLTQIFFIYATILGIMSVISLSATAFLSFPCLYLAPFDACTKEWSLMSKKFSCNCWSIIVQNLYFLFESSSTNPFR